ncbi:MAG TPA: cellulase family glycosylhydrolase [Clostridiaceae bacterium]|nr:cellulase family glycosylhydrolase [Clostridiaceae bacterium]
METSNCDKKGRWSREKAWLWYNSRPWICGFNYLPSTAVNSTEMWQKDSFDEATIDKELRWASEYGYNSCRVFLQFIVWNHDPEGYKKRMGRFLEIADSHGISTTFILFDDCAFSGKEPYLGKQNDPIPGVHNSGWTPSPGPSIADDESMQGKLEAYVKDILSGFSDDKRVLMWDLYNEPGNSDRKEKSLDLLKNAFLWAREVCPCQPLTSGVWNCQATEKACIENSDIITFHCYENYDKTTEKIKKFKSEGYPVINTEWMARKFDSLIKTHLPLFKEENVGCYQWGLVQGKTQTYYPWGSVPGSPVPEVWFHDVLTPDGTPYDQEEMEVVKEIMGKNIIQLKLEAKEMTPEIMQDLEDRGLIYRLCPGHDELNPKQGETSVEQIYACDSKYGAHMLITVTVNRTEFSAFGTHPDNEDVFLIGDANCKPMYFLFGLCKKDEFVQKINNGSLTEKDLIVFVAKYNDPQVSFFTVLKDAPHGEAVAGAEGKPPSFYVTEPTSMPLDIIDFKNYKISVS